jgi:hypothetical protein
VLATILSYRAKDKEKEADCHERLRRLTEESERYAMELHELRLKELR